MAVAAALHIWRTLTSFGVPPTSKRPHYSAITITCPGSICLTTDPIAVYNNPASSFPLSSGTQVVWNHSRLRWPWIHAVNVLQMSGKPKTLQLPCTLSEQGNIVRWGSDISCSQKTFSSENAHWFLLRGVLLSQVRFFCWFPLKDLRWSIPPEVSEGVQYGRGRGAGATRTPRVGRIPRWSEPCVSH